MNEDRIVDIFLVVAVISVIILKITNVITISWLWLLAPIWIPFSIGIVLAIILLILFIIECKIYKEKK